MLTKVKTKVLVICITVLCTGCFGSSSSSSNNNTTVVLQVVPGPWAGTYSIDGGSQTAVTGTTTASGFGYFADDQGNVFMIESIPQQSPFNATVIGTAPSGQTFSDGRHVETFNANGSFTSTSTVTNMQATLTGIDPSSYTPYAGFASTGVNGNYTLKSTIPYAGTPSIGGLVGQWNGYYIGKSSTSVVITINSDGTFSGNDGMGCSINGSLVLQDPGTNTYYVNYTTNGSGCPGVLSGLAYQSTKDISGDFGGVSGTYLYMGLFGPNVAYSVELKL